MTSPLPPKKITFTRNIRAGEETKTVLESDNYGEKIGSMHIMIFDKKLVKYPPTPQAPSWRQYQQAPRRSPPQQHQDLEDITLNDFEERLGKVL